MDEEMQHEPSLVETLDEQASWLIDLLPQLAAAAAVFAFFVLVGWLVGRAIKAGVTRRGDRVHAAFLSKLPVWLFGFIGLMVAVDYLGLEGVSKALLAGGGATAIILGFAFREVGENFLAGLFLAFSRPFRLGDLIRSGDLPEGVVKAVDLRNTHVRTSDGRDIYVPNARIFNDPLTNFTRDGLRRPTFTVGVDYHAPLDAVRTAILSAVSAVDGVLAQPRPRVELIDFPAAYALIEVSVWIDTFRGTDYPAVQTAAMEACRRAILDNGWTISSDVATAVELSRSGNGGGP